MTRLKAAMKRGRPTKAMALRNNQGDYRGGDRTFSRGRIFGNRDRGAAARAGVSKVTIYSRFPPRPDLFGSGRGRSRGEMVRRSRKEGDANLQIPPRGRLEHHALVVVESLQPDIVAFSQLIAAEQRRFPESRASIASMPLRSSLPRSRSRQSRARRADRPWMRRASR